MNLNLNCQFLSSKIQASSQARLVYLLLEVLGDHAAASLPLNVSLVIDCSDSMHILMVTSQQFEHLARRGQLVEVVTDGVPAWRLRGGDSVDMTAFPRRIDHVAEALRQTAGQLRPVDRFSLIAFASSARTLIPSSPGSERELLMRAAGQLEQLNLGDETEMADGLALGFHELSITEDTAAARRIILLTDGYTRNIPQCYRWAQSARERGVTLSTLGIGSEFNEELLIPLADSTGGHAYYVEKAEDLPGILRQEFSAALSVACRSMEIKLRLAPNVELRRAHRVLPNAARLDPGPNQGGSYTFFLGDLESGAPPALLLELILPPLSPGAFKPGEVVLSWQDPASSGSRLNRRQPLALQVEAGMIEDRNPAVARMVQKIAAYELSTRALADAAAQGPAGASQRLRAAATRLLEMDEPLLAEAMQRRADTVELGGQVDAGLTKRLRYDTRSVAAINNKGKGQT